LLVNESHPFHLLEKRFIMVVTKEVKEKIDALTKADMTEMLFEELGLNKREAKEMIEKFFRGIKIRLRSWLPCEIIGVWQLSYAVKSRKTRPKSKNWRTYTYISQKGCYISPWAKIKNESRYIRGK
jgi:integration host factor subunit alpha